MINIIFYVILLGILYYISYDCSRFLTERLSSKATLIFVTVVSFILMLAYMYYNKHEIYFHYDKLDFEIIMAILILGCVVVILNMFYLEINFSLFF